MSFSQEIKTEIANTKINKEKEYIYYEVLGYIMSNIKSFDDQMHFVNENKDVILRYIYILKNILGLVVVEDSSISKKKTDNTQYMLDIVKIEEYKNVIGKLQKLSTNVQTKEESISFLRGVFLASGYVLNPEDSYHLEFVVNGQDTANYIKNAILNLGLKCNILVRKKKYVVYIKEGDNISELLILLGANVGVLKFEEKRIEKEMNNNMNRTINCETGNLSKTMHASKQQLEDIEYLKNHNIFDLLPDKLKEACNLRIENPDYSLIDIANELGISKSGVNNRFAKVHKIVMEEGKKNEGI